MREMSNRTRFDFGQGGASVETGHQSMNLTTLRGHAVESKTNQRHSVMGEAGPKNFTNVPGRITSRAPPSPQCPPLIRGFLGWGPTRKKIGGVTGIIGLRAVSPHRSSTKKIN
ncbi:uncharacterized protein TNCV_2681201 [Trichonephila clavipes]|uniref:Uncharacterized protein n=1 Tax=Trichonephila clavipes TaxID=2585209 RepID=A0A8X6S3W3_TRICX|nr:uncharacterized protein TNCV_2681201 [Trichonephila clavipes]